MKKFQLIFFGNETLATGVSTHCPVVSRLISDGHDVLSIVVKSQSADKKRGMPPEIESLAVAHDIPLLTPNNTNELTKIINQYKPEIAILAAYGRIVPQSVIDLFPLGVLNVHPSLLPQYRGPTPIESAILDGADQTGVSIMKLVAKMDEGPVFAQKALDLAGNESKQAIADQLGTIGAELLAETLSILGAASQPPTSQDDLPQKVSYTKLIEKSDGVIDWNKPAEQIEREVRAYAGWPTSYTRLGSVEVTIIQAHAVDSSQEPQVPGRTEVLQEGVLMVCCGQGYLCIDRLKPTGKSEMSTADFLRGYRQHLLPK